MFVARVILINFHSVPANLAIICLPSFHHRQLFTGETFFRSLYAMMSHLKLLFIYLTDGNS